MAGPRKPEPAMAPAAAAHQRVAAVFRPRMFSPSRRITPAPRKPMPEAIWAAIRVGLASWSLMAAIRQNMAAPTATSTLVRRPASLWRHCRSMPIITPTTSAAASRSSSSYVVIRAPSQGQRSSALCHSQMCKRRYQSFMNGVSTPSHSRVAASYRPSVHSHGCSPTAAPTRSPFVLEPQELAQCQPEEEEGKTPDDDDELPEHGQTHRHDVHQHEPLPAGQWRLTAHGLLWSSWCQPLWRVAWTLDARGYP